MTGGTELGRQERKEMWQVLAAGGGHPVSLLHPNFSFTGFLGARCKFADVLGAAGGAVAVIVGVV
jgi:hypothetical protein